jgi:nucleoid-associated protein YgaU
MKVTRKQEVVVGLSVLLTLTMVLIGVIVWRLTRPSQKPDTQLARLEIPHEEHQGKEIETRRPTFEEPAPAAEAPRDHVVSNPWVAHAPENSSEKHEAKKEEKHEIRPEENRYRAAGLAPKAIDVGVNPPPASPKHHDDEQRYQPSREPAVLAPEASDDRYSVPRPSRAESPAPSPMVIQVSGDTPSAPTPTPRPVTLPNGDYSNAGRSDTDMSGNRRPAAPSLPPNEMPPAAGNYGQPGYSQPSYGAPSNAATPAAVNYPQQNYPTPAARDQRGGYESTPAAMPVENAAGYPGAGNAQANAPRREEYQQQVPPNPLRSDGMYEVLPNDSYWTISQRVYGTGAYFRALAEVNRGKAARPDRLSPGLLISTPPVAQLEKDYPDFCPRPNRREAVRNRVAGAASLAAYNGGRTYTVQEGDTVWTIARNELGKVTRWSEIVQLNRDTLGKDYDYLTPGMKLVLPPTENQSQDRTARRNDTATPAGRY